MEKRQQNLFLVLAGIFITNALVAEIIGTKIFSFEGLVGADPAHLNILGFTMDFNLTAGVVLWPVVFITTDLINEYFGKPGVRQISYLTAILITYAFVALFLTIELPPADWWLAENSRDPQGNAFNINYAFGKIFGQSQRIIIGSLAAFLLGQLVDVYVFHRLRKITGKRFLWLRSTGSTVVSQFIDSFVVLFIAFYGTFSTPQILAIGLTNYLYKFVVALAMTPVIYAGHAWIDRYLGHQAAEGMSDSAAEKSSGFF